MQIIKTQQVAGNAKACPLIIARPSLYSSKLGRSSFKEVALSQIKCFHSGSHSFPTGHTISMELLFCPYLMHPERFELADHHRIQAITEILQAIEHKESNRTFSYSLQDLEDNNSFFNAIYPRIPYEQLNRIKFERFLKVYGNRYPYKHVSANYTTQEPTIRQFSWDDCGV
ncbi:hypothetical protein P5G60_10240 [Paenibacillus jamilae]|nr:hypothetical protein [Paenibacillus jamilae]